MEDEGGRRCAGVEVRWLCREVVQARVKGRLLRRVMVNGVKRRKVEENSVMV